VEILQEQERQEMIPLLENEKDISIVGGHENNG